MQIRSEQHRHAARDMVGKGEKHDLERKCSYIKDLETIYHWVKPVQGQSGKVLCEVCLSHFSVSHGGEYDVKQHRQCETHKKHYN